MTMTDKDPKDMTSSELLRWAANYADITCRACREMGFGCDSGEVCFCEQVWDHIADKIDAELAEARKDAIRESKKPMWWFRSAIKRGEDWPEPRDGEKFRDYLHRCFLPRPRFEDGEPVSEPDFGDDAFIEVFGNGDWLINCPDGGQIEGSRSQRVKRPAPEALGADGLPIKAGETVWGILSGIEGTVSSMNDDSTAYVKWDDGRWSPCIDCCNLTHTPPETQERIDEDKGKKGTEYWRCVGFLCGDCPAEIDGKRPSDRYGVLNCSIAQGMDIARRQADLDARKGGE